jgi:hypothetical protein
MCRLLSCPVNIIEVELIGTFDFNELLLADFKIIAACKKLRSLKILNMHSIARLELVGACCRKLEHLSLRCWETTILPLEAFPQVKSLEYRFQYDRPYCGPIIGSVISSSAIPDRLLAHFAQWINLVELSGNFIFAGMGKLVNVLPNLASYTEEAECPTNIASEFVCACNGKPVASTLRTLRFPHGFAEDYDGDSGDTAAQAIFQTFRNLSHLEIRFSEITLSDIETVTALSRLTNLETLDFQGIWRRG